MKNLDGVTLFHPMYRRVRSISAELPGSEWKPRHRSDNPSLYRAAFNQLAQPLFNKNTVAWLEFVRVQ